MSIAMKMTNPLVGQFWICFFFLIGSMDSSAAWNAKVPSLTWGPRKCFDEPVNFKYNDSVPYTFQEQERGEKPFNFSARCYETQECLGVRDDTLWNLRVAASGTSFLIFENSLLPHLSPPTAKAIIDNAHVLFDDESIMHIEGVGTYKGATAIGNYLAIPHQIVSGMVVTSFESSQMKVVDKNRVVIETEWLQDWSHLGNGTHSTPLRFEKTYYPCSTKIKTIIMELTDFTLQAFSDSSLVSGTRQGVCNTIMDNCVGELQQYDSFQDCMEYMDALPHFDPVCQNKIGPMAVQGNSYMCKYLHQFMIPFEPEQHCFHAGKGRFDSAGKRKCVPTECLDEETPEHLRPELMFPLQEGPADTYFALKNGSFVETLVTSEVSREAKSDSSTICNEAEATELAAATVLTLPHCMVSLNHGSCYANCTQAIQTYLGRFAENGAVCRCNDGSSDKGKLVMKKSAMLTKLRIDPKVLLEFCSKSLSSVEYPDCLGELDSYSCPLQGTYRGTGACYKWDYESLEKAIHRDWGKEAQFSGLSDQFRKRISTSDLVAATECSVLSIWGNQARSDEHYYARYSATGSQLFTDSLDHGIRVHPSLGPIELKHDRILLAMSQDQIRDNKSAMSESCYFGSMKEIHPVILDAAVQTVGGGLEQQYLFPPIAYSTGSDLHRKTRRFVESVFPGLWGRPEPGHSYTNILDNVLKLRNMTRDDLRNNLVKVDIESLIREVTFRAMLEDELPYIDQKLGDDLDDLRAGGAFRPDRVHELQGGFWPSSYMAAKHQLRRHLQMSGVLTVETMEDILILVGLNGTIAPDGVGGAYDLLAIGMLGPANTETSFSSLVERFRWDECEARHLWHEVGGKAFLTEHLRLNMDVPGFIAKHSATERVARMYHLHSAHLDPSVFEDPLVFNPKRSNLHQAMFFNGLEEDFEEHMDSGGYVDSSSFEEAPSLRRWCIGRHLTYNLITELAPLFFPPETDEYYCHEGIRARYGVEFTSELVKVHTDEVELEVLKAGPKSTAENIMILLGTTLDPSVGWSAFIANMRNQNKAANVDFWVLTVPGWGGKGTRIEQYSIDILTEYIADLIREAKKSYKRVFLFGRYIVGSLCYYVADRVGKENLHGFITHSTHPAVHAIVHSGRPADENDFVPWIDPMSELFAFGDQFPLLDFVKNETWWNQAWEWDFQSFQRKTGAHQYLELDRAFYTLTPDGKVTFVDFGAADRLDPDMHMLTIGHDNSLFHNTQNIQAGLLRTTPRPGVVQKFKQVREKPNMLAHYYNKGEAGEELAEIVASFIDQSCKIRFSSWRFLTLPVDFSESAFEWKAQHPTITFFIWIISGFIILAGLIAEITLGKMLVRRGGFPLWLFVQVFAPIVCLGCFLAADPITIPLFTLALFKMGFPEVTHALIAPVKHPKMKNANKPLRALDFMSGVAYVIHHFGATLIYMVVTFHEMDPFVLGMPMLALAFQHLIVFLKYLNPVSHMIAMMVVEVWFQLESYYVFSFATETTKVGLAMLLLAHYYWFVHGCVMAIAAALGSSSKRGAPLSNIIFDNDPTMMRFSTTSDHKIMQSDEERAPFKNDEASNNRYSGNNKTSDNNNTGASPRHQRHPSSTCSFSHESSLSIIPLTNSRSAVIVTKKDDEHGDQTMPPSSISSRHHHSKRQETLIMFRNMHSNSLTKFANIFDAEERAWSAGPSGSEEADCER